MHYQYRKFHIFCLIYVLVFATGILFFQMSSLASANSFGSKNNLEMERAVHLVKEKLFTGSFEGKRVWVKKNPVPAGYKLLTVKGNAGFAEEMSWLLFVDDMAFANWEHPARFILVSKESGTFKEYCTTVPPPEAFLEECEEITPETGELVTNAPSTVSFNRFPGQRPMNPNSRGGMNYAVLISGGADKSNNHIRYWNDLSNIYKGLVSLYLFPDPNIVVLCSDGLDPAPDRSNGTNSPPDLDGDGDDDINYPATREYIYMVFGALKNILKEEDLLFVFTTDHGGTNGGWSTYLNLWNWEELQDSELGALVDALPGCVKVFTMEQCYSGGFEDDLVGTKSGRIFSSAAAYNEVSWAMPPSYEYDTYVFYWTAAVRWEDAYGTHVNADSNKDGIIDMNEAFLYAEANDISDETPQYAEYPQGLGRQVSLYGAMKIGTLQGTVRDQGSGQGIQGVKVKILSSTINTVTRANGIYSMLVPAEEWLTVRASSFGYLAQDKNVFVSEGATVTLDFDLVKSPTGDAGGVVRDSDGIPLYNATVTALETPLSSVKTNQQGYYRIKGLPADSTYVLKATETNHMPGTKAVLIEEGVMKQVDFALDPGFYDDMENGEGNFKHYKIKNLYSDQWHLDNYRNHTPSGSWSWKCGGQGSNGYDPRLDAALETGPIILGSNAILQFYHWIETATVNQWSVYDGGIIEISTDGGSAWAQIEPVGGYPYSIFYNLFNPFPAGTPCFGSSSDWKLETFNLSGYSGEVRIRFHFGSGIMADGEGWYIDDIVVATPNLIHVEAVPRNNTVPRGGKLEVDLTITNLTAEKQTIKCYVDILLPNGKPYAKNPVAGPSTLILPPNATRQTSISHNVPVKAPTGSYTYIFKVECPPGTPWTQDSFGFNITE